MNHACLYTVSELRRLMLSLEIFVVLGYKFLTNYCIDLQHENFI